MTEMINHNRRAIPWAIGACLIWSSAFAFIKYGLEYVEPLTFAGVRFMLAGLLLVPLCGSPIRLVKTLRTHIGLIAGISILQTVILYGALFVGLDLAGGAQCAIIIGASPLASAVLSHFLMKHDRMTLSQTGAIALGMAGIVLIAFAAKPWSPAGLRELAGMGLCMIAVISSTLANIVIARHRGEIAPAALNSAQMFLGGVALFVIAMFVEPMPRSLPNWRFFVALGWLSSVSAIAFTIWFYWLRRVKVSHLNMWKFIIPVCGAILAWLILPDESPNIPSVIGMVCVAAAVYLAYRQSNSEFTRQAA